jgi:hypothetical protein
MIAGRLTTVAALLAVFLPLASSAQAKPSSRGAAAGAVIRACYDKSSGRLRVLRAGQSCKENESPLQWSVNGPAGSRGAAGSIGPAGAPGRAGFTGLTGPAGHAGAPGENGPTGATGATGASGPPGAGGAPGGAGTTGPTGATGATGARGATGATGATGSAGSGTTGPTGATGLTGAAGVTGVTGASASFFEAGGVPAKLPSGHSETGFWQVTGGAIPTTGRREAAPISFALPLASALDSTHVFYLAKGESNAHCGGTAQTPLAAAGYLCVYTNLEENHDAGTPAEPGHITVTIDNIEGAAGASTTGAVVSFAVSFNEPQAFVSDYGSWAVTAE